MARTIAAGRKRGDVSKDEFLARMQRISAPIPADVELGIHLCYGDFEAKHFIEPRDAGKMVEFANALAKVIAHPLAFIHMPVPVERTTTTSSDRSTACASTRAPNSISEWSMPRTVPRAPASV